MKVKNISLLMDIQDGVSDWNKPFIMQNEKEHSVYILQKGSLELNFGFSHYLVKPGMITGIFPGEKYSASLRSDDIYGYKITFTLNKKEEINTLFNRAFSSKKSLPVSDYGMQLIEFLISLNSLPFEQKQKAESHMLSTFFYLLFSSNKQEEDVTDKNRKYVEQTISYMNSRIYSKLSLEDLAAHINICKHHYLRLFKKVTGMPPMTYFIKMKVNKAAELLTTTQMSINTIAEKLNFSSDAHFSSVFKKHTSVRPTIYRKHHLLYKERYMVDSKEYNKQAHSLLQTIIDASPDMIFYKNQDSVLLGCNTAFCRIMGLSKSQIIGNTDWDLFPEDEARFYHEIDMHVLEMGKPNRNKEWMTFPDGTAKKFEVYKAPFYDSVGQVKGILGISRDITSEDYTESTSA